MSYVRWKMDLAVKEPIPPALQGQLNGIKAHICVFKAFSERINPGHENEENTVYLKEHICHHDTGEPCEPETEICEEK